MSSFWIIALLPLTILGLLKLIAVFLAAYHNLNSMLKPFIEARTTKSLEAERQKQAEEDQLRELAEKYNLPWSE